MKLPTELLPGPEVPAQHAGQSWQAGLVIWLADPPGRRGEMQELKEAQLYLLLCIASYLLHFANVMLHDLDFLSFGSLCRLLGLHRGKGYINQAFTQTGMR